MRFVKMEWRAAPKGHAVLTYAVLGDDNYEIERVEVFADGTWGFADEANQIGETALAEKPWPDPDDLTRNDDPDISCSYMSKDQYTSEKSRIFSGS